MRRRDVARLAAAAAMVLSAAACGGDGDRAVDRSAFVDRTQERFAARPAEAACIADYVYADYDEAAVRTIHEDGVTALPKGLWDPYFYAVIGCLTEDER